MATRILIADDHGVLRAGLRALLELEQGLEVVGEAADGEDALSLAGELQPDIVLTDITMPRRTGIEVASELQSRCPDTRVVILSMHEDADLVHAAIDAGCVGYIPKRAVDTELIDAVRAVESGNVYVHHSLTRSLLAGRRSMATRDSLVETLTARETEVVRLIAEGHTNRQIGSQLCISVRTVETHRANAMGKLGVDSRVELVRYVREQGLA